MAIRMMKCLFLALLVAWIGASYAHAGEAGPLLSKTQCAVDELVNRSIPDDVWKLQFPSGFRCMLTAEGLTFDLCKPVWILERQDRQVKASWGIGPLRSRHSTRKDDLQSAKYAILDRLSLLGLEPQKQDKRLMNVTAGRSSEGWSEVAQVLQERDGIRVAWAVTQEGDQRIEAATLLQQIPVTPHKRKQLEALGLPDWLAGVEINRVHLFGSRKIEMRCVISESMSKADLQKHLHETGRDCGMEATPGRLSDTGLYYATSDREPLAKVRVYGDPETRLYYEFTLTQP